MGLGFAPDAGTVAFAGCVCAVPKERSRSGGVNNTARSSFGTGVSSFSRGSVAHLRRSRLQISTDFCTKRAAAWPQKHWRVCRYRSAFISSIPLRFWADSPQSGHRGCGTGSVAAIHRRALTLVRRASNLRAMNRTTRTGQRDYAMLLSMATYGLGSGEVRGLTLESIDWRRRQLRSPGPKPAARFVCPFFPLRRR